MGSDKAMLKLGGRPLIVHAVAKLSRITPNVRILAGRDGGLALAGYAPLVYDLHPDTGPIGGIQAALEDSTLEWNLILPVDLPFVPTLFLQRWVQSIAQGRRPHTRIALFSVFGRIQPTLLMVHREAGPIFAEVIARGEYKLLPALERVARDLALPGARAFERVPYILPIDEHLKFDDWEVHPADPAAWQLLTEAQCTAKPFWFSNLNTRADFDEAETHVDALDT